MKSPYKLDMVDKAKYGSQMFTILFNKLTGVEIHWICGIPGYTRSHDRPKQVKAGQNDALQLRSLSDPTEKNKGLEILEQ